MKRIAQINEDGTTDIGGVRCKVVRLVDIEFLPSHLRIDILKDAAAIDLSSLPVVPSMHGLGSIPVTDSWGNSDNLAIALCCYFSDVLERPKDDPLTERGWGTWVEAQANATLARILEALGIAP